MLRYEKEASYSKSRIGIITSMVRAGATIRRTAATYTPGWLISEYIYGNQLYSNSWNSMCIVL